MKPSEVSRFIPMLCLMSSLPVIAGGPKSPLVPVTSFSGDCSSPFPPAPRIGTLAVNIRSGYRSGGLGLPSFVGGDSLVTSPVGETDAPSDQKYNDGFVRQDAGTQRRLHLELGPYEGSSGGPRWVIGNLPHHAASRPCCS